MQSKKAVSEFELGYEQGVLDASLGNHCKFAQNHSEYAIGYLQGWTCYMDLDNKGLIQ